MHQVDSQTFVDVEKRVILTHGDCRDVLEAFCIGRRFPEMSYPDAVITDPPYGIGATYPHIKDKRENHHELILPVVMMSELLTDGPKLFYQAQKNLRWWPEWFPFDFRIFAACKGFCGHKKNIKPQYAWDPIIFWGKVPGEPDVRVKDWDVQVAPSFGRGRPKNDHPYKKNIKQIRTLINIFTEPGDVILDPFMGTGVIGVAAVQMGRGYIGIDNYYTWFSKGVMNISNQIDQGELFT